MRLGLLGCLLLAACGGGAPTPGPAARLRLWVDLAATLEALPSPPAPRPVLVEDFAGDLAGWEAIVTPGRAAGGLEAELGLDGERPRLRLTGVHGGLHATVPVEPDTCYAFAGLLRAVGLASDAEDFDGARFWLAEASGEASFEEFRTTRRELMTASWSSPGVASDTGWQKRERVFVTTPRTRLLHVVCALATQHDVRAGAVEFAELRLEQRTREDWWLTRVAQENAARASIDPAGPGPSSPRRVSAELGLENRPAFALLPGERLRFELPALAPGARLDFGLGPFAPALLAGRGGQATLVLRLDGVERLRAALDLPRDPSDARWEPHGLALGPEARVLELAVEGAAPLAIGAPLVRTDAPAPALPNVLLVSIDTLRADRVGAYGHPGGNTPHLDRLAARGLLCADASAQAPYTLPTHATILTGQFPSVHGVVAHESRLGAARSTSLAEVLARAGYATQAFTAGGFVNSVFGLDQGFDGFAEIDPIRELDSHYGRTLIRKHGEARAAALLEGQGHAAVERWIDARGSEPFLLFLHTYAVHDYDAPRRFLRCRELGCEHPRVPLSTRSDDEAAAFTPAMRAHVEHLYEAALRYTDERLGALLARLEARGLLADTIVVVTSDHGEEFFEHGHLQHGRTLYEELLRIPLLFAGPGFPAQVLERPAMQIDIAPTVLARLGLPRPPQVQGLDLLGPAWPARAVWSEVDSRFAHQYARREEDGWKTIHGPSEKPVQFPNARAWEQYDLARDPRETLDRAQLPEPRLEAARRALTAQRETLEALGASLGAAAHGEVDEGTLRDLEALGYGGE